MKYYNCLGYVAGPYTAPTQEEVTNNIHTARETSAELWRMQFPNICPHMNSAGFENPEWEINPKYFYPGTIAMLDRCEFMVLCNPDMEANKRSSGTMKEIEYCYEEEIPWFQNIEEFKEYVRFAEEKLEDPGPDNILFYYYDWRISNPHQQIS